MDTILRRREGASMPDSGEAWPRRQVSRKRVQISGHLPRRVQPQDSGEAWPRAFNPKNPYIPGTRGPMRRRIPGRGMASPLSVPGTRGLLASPDSGEARARPRPDTGMVLANVGDAGRVAGFGRGMASPLRTQQVKRCDLTAPWFPGIPRYQTRRVRAHFRIACSRRRAR